MKEPGIELLPFIFIVYLNHVNVISKSIQGHFKHDFSRQVVFFVKDHVSLQRSNLVVTRILSGIHEISNFIALYGVKKFLPQSEKNSGKNKLYLEASPDFLDLITNYALCKITLIP